MGMTFLSFSGKEHLAYAHQLWKDHLHQGDWVIDATCGNGYDALALSQCILKKGTGRLFCLDIQKKALIQTRSYLTTHLSQEVLTNVSFHHQCHRHFPQLNFPPRLIVYNLGYLPGGRKAITTQKQITLDSLREALHLIASAGAISVMCYPGHIEGARESKAVVDFFQKIDNKKLKVYCYQYKNRSHAPFLIWVKKYS